MGVGLVHYTADDGALRTIRQVFTSVAAAEPFARVAAGRSAFRVSDLLALGSLLAGLYYGRTRINTSTGERWFCSEAEVRVAGWRRATRWGSFFVYSTPGCPASAWRDLCHVWAALGRIPLLALLRGPTVGAFRPR